MHLELEKERSTKKAVHLALDFARYSDFWFIKYSADFWCLLVWLTVYIILE